MRKNKQSEAPTWIIEWTKWKHLYLLLTDKQPAIYSKRMKANRVSTFFFSFHSRFTSLSVVDFCIAYIFEVEQFDIRLPMWFDSNSDCNVWMTLDLPNKWNKFSFLWCFDTSQTPICHIIIRAIVYVRCKWSANQSGLSVDFVACETELALPHTQNRAQNPARNSVCSLVALEALISTLNNICNNFIRLPIQTLTWFHWKIGTFFCWFSAENIWSLSLCSE